jgi:hypothetical protein
MKIAPIVASLVMPSAVLSLACAAAAAGDDDLARALEEMARLRAQNERIAATNAELAAKVDRLERHAAEDGSWLTEERAQEIRAIVGDVLADAAARDSLAADGSTAGWDKSKGFFLASGDGNFTLGIRGDAQFRWNYNHRDIGSAVAAAGSPAAGTADDTSGLEWRRVRLTLAGNVIDPSWTYDFKFANNRTGTANNTTYLDDAYVQKAFDGGATFKIGQFKLPFMREDQVSSTGQAAVERSLVNEVYSVSRSQGLSLGWSDKTLRFEAFYGDALRANATVPTTGAGAAGGVATGQNTGFSVNGTDYAVAGRIEFKPLGEWKQFKDFQSFRGDELGVLLGVAAYAEAISSPAATAPESIWSATADASIEFGGASILVYGVYREVTLAGAQATRGGGSDDTLEQWGALVQGGVFVTDDVEVFARYELGDTDTDKFRTAASAQSATGGENGIVTAGFNWWPAGSKVKYVKFTADVGFAFDPLVDFNGTGAGYLPDYTAAGSDTNDGQWLVRTQLQFLF